jgi:hypothetical protein
LLRKVLGFTVAAVLPFLIAVALLTPRGVTASLPDSRPDQDAGPAGQMTVGAPSPAPADEREDGPADLLGNPISDAVARYKFDATGSLYELHSPQTELPRLAAPKS